MAVQSWTIYTFFPSFTKRWAVSRKHVAGLSVKPFSETRWNCRMERVKDVLHQAAEVCNALEESAEKIDDAKAKSNEGLQVSGLTNFVELLTLTSKVCE